MAQLAKVKRLAYDAGWMRWGWPERVGGLGGSTILRAYLGEALTARIWSTRASTHDRGARPDDDRLRPARARGDDGAAAAARRRDVVPGLLRAGHRQQPRGAAVPGRPGRRRLAGDGPEGLDELRAVRRALRPAHPHRRPGFGAPRHHRAVRRHGHPRHHGAPAADDERPPRVLRGLLRRRRGAGRRTLGEVDRGWAVAMGLLPYERSTALWHRGAFLQRAACRAAHGVADGQLHRAPVGEAFAAAVRVPGPLAGDPAPDGGRRNARRRDLDRQGAARGRRAGRLRPGRRRSRRRRPARRRRRSGDGGPNSCTRAPRRSTAAAPRSSATSSPAGCSTSERTADGRRRSQAVRSRASRHVDRAHSGAALDAALDELGWHDALAEDARDAVSILFELQGAANATSARSTRALRHALGSIRRPRDRAAAARRHRTARARRRAPADLPGLATAAALAADGGPSSLRSTQKAAVAAVAVDRPTRRAARSPGWIPPRSGRGRRRRWRQRLSPAAASSAGPPRSRPASSRSRTNSSAPPGRCCGWPATRPRTRPVRPADRVFQALRHRLAESLVAVEARRRRVNAAWDDPSPLAAALAKAIAGQARAPSRSTPSRCSPAWATPPSTRSTTTCAGPCSSTSCSAPAAP